MQIESRVDQDTEISQKLTLWGQVGSRVIRGNLMVIPIAESLIYVEPIYLQATQSKLPELKRVIFAYKDSIVMAENLDTAISKVFNSSQQQDRNDSYSTFDNLKTTGKQGLDSMHSVIDRLIREYSQFKQHAKAQDWSKFGKSLDSIDRTIKKLIKFQPKNKEPKKAQQ
jgi:uncharacterized protein